MFYSHFGFSNFKFLSSIIEDCSVRSTGADETDTLKSENSMNTEPKNNRLTFWCQNNKMTVLRPFSVNHKPHLCIGCKFHGSLGRYSITRIKHCACWNGTEHCEILQCHLRRAILTWTKFKVKKHFHKKKKRKEKMSK